MEKQAKREKKLADRRAKKQAKLGLEKKKDNTIPLDQVITLLIVNCPYIYQLQNNFEVPTLKTDVDIQVTGLLTTTKVKQYFINPTNSHTEAIYLFPLPDKAVVDKMKIKIGNRIIGLNKTFIVAEISANHNKSLKRIKKRLDHAEHGGALLLGVNGICVIGHGSSKALSVVSALRLAHSAASHGVMDDLAKLQKSPAGNT